MIDLLVNSFIADIFIWTGEFLIYWISFRRVKPRWWRRSEARLSEEVMRSIFPMVVGLAFYLMVFVIVGRLLGVGR